MFLYVTNMANYDIILGSDNYCCQYGFKNLVNCTRKFPYNCYLLLFNKKTIILKFITKLY